MNQFIETIKWAGPLVTIIVAIIANTIALYQFHLKFKTSNEFDKLFLNKAEQKKLNDFQFLSEWLLICSGIYILPMIGFIEMGDLSKKYESYLSTMGILAMYIALIFYFISITKYALHKKIPKEKHRKAKKSAAINMLLSLIWIYPLSYLAIKKQAWLALTPTLLFCLLYSLFFTVIVFKTRNKIDIEYLIDVLTEEEIKKIALIHAYNIDDKRAVLYEGKDTFKNTFYVCDFSSKIYIRYSKVQPLHLEKNIQQDEN